MIPRDLTFSQPLMGTFLLFLPLFIYLFYIAKRNNKQKLSQLTSNDEISRIAVVGDSRRLIFKGICFCLFWLLASLALMRPIGNAHYEKQPLANLPGQDVIFLLDSSYSMSVRDSPGKISRFDYAKEIVDAIAKKLNGYDVMLVTFSGDANLVVPQTQDTFFLRLRLKDLELNEDVGTFGTNFFQTLTSLKKLYFFDIASSAPALIILSDGGDTGLDDLPIEQRNLKIGRIEQAVNNQFPNTRIYGIGLGTFQGGVIQDVTYQGHQVTSRLEPSILSRLSGMTGGKFFNASDYTPQSLANHLVSMLGREANGQFSEREVLVKTVDEFFQLPLFLSILFLFLFLYFPSVATKVSLWLLISLPGFSSEDFLIRHSVTRENFDAAIQYYHRMKSILPPSSHPVIDYNLGTIALNEGRLDDALEQLADIQWSSANDLVKFRSFINMAATYQQLAEKTADPLEAYFDAYQAFLILHSLPNSDSYHFFKEDDLSIKETINQAFNRLEETEDQVILLGLVWSQLSLLKSNFSSKVSLDKWMANPHLSSLFTEFIPFDPKEKAESFILIKEKIKQHILNLQLENSQLLQYLLSFYTVGFDSSFIALLQQKLTQQIPHNSDVNEANHNLKVGMRAEKDREIPMAMFQFLQAKLALQSLKVMQEQHSVKRALQLLIIKSQNVLASRRIFLKQPILRWSERLKPLESEVLKRSQDIFKIIQDWQRLRFNRGICQCLPWNDVIPLLKQADDQWKMAAGNEGVYEQISLHKKAIQLWREALKLLAQVPESPLKEQERNKLLSELQEMQSLDKQPVPLKPIPQEGKFW